QLSYGELNRRSNQLAHLLIREGIGAEEMVGLALPRGLEMIIGLLGVLKAGGAYVPLDPEYPQERLEFMREDAGLACLVTVSSVAERIAEKKETEKGEKGEKRKKKGEKRNKVKRVVLDSGSVQKKLGGMKASNPGAGERVEELLPAHPAYVIYTSG